MNEELHVGLCGLAYAARICDETSILWQPTERGRIIVDADEHAQSVTHENDWSLRGRVIDTKSLRNPLSGSELLWVHLDLQQLRLEVLVNRASFPHGTTLEVGQMLAADVWLQGHVLDRRTVLAAFEGADARHTPARAWRHLKRTN